MLSGLTLTLFRSHRRLVLPLDGRPVAIWGPNGAGKTNILEALSLLSPGRGLRRAAAEDLAMRGAPGWKVTALLNQDEIETFAEGGPREVRINGKPAPQVALGRLASVVWLVPAMDRLWTDGAEGRRRFLDRLTLSFIPDHAEATLAYDKAMRERNRLLKDDVRDGRWYAALEARLAEEGARIVANRRTALAQVMSAQDDAATVFPTARLTIEQGEAVEAAALAAARDRDRAAGRTLDGPHRADLGAVFAAKNQPAAQCSTGEQKALLISIMLANARALAGQGRRPILLLDEVGAHLDAGRRAALYDEVCALSAQVFMTATGIELFEGLEGRAQGLEVGEAEGCSAVVSCWR